MVSSGARAAGAAFGLWAVWTLATWLLEGRIETFLRPDAVADRLLYIVVANIIVGTLGAAAVIRRIAGRRSDQRQLMGFGPAARTALWVPVGLILGLALYFGQGAPSLAPIVIVNVYAQVMVVSIAEVLVCWAVVAGTIAQSPALPKWLSVPLAAVLASGLFGLYHFAHSPPFDTWPMVALLASVGLLTSAFFFLSRDVYATIAFHNFLAVYGVLQALAGNDKLGSYQTLQPPLLGTGLVGLLILIAADIMLIRRKA